MIITGSETLKEKFLVTSGAKLEGEAAIRAKQGMNQNRVMTHLLHRRMQIKL